MHQTNIHVYVMLQICTCLR